MNKPESVDPIRDIDAIDLELILADLEVVSNRLGRQQKAAKTGNKAAAAEAAWLADLAAWLEAGKPARSFAFDESDDAVKQGAGPALRQAGHLRLQRGRGRPAGRPGREPLLSPGRRPRQGGKRPGYPHLRQDRGGHRRFHPGGKNRVPAGNGH